MTPMRRIRLLAAAAFAALLAPAPASAQTNIEIFGQNRVQYRRFDWKFFDTEHFRVYHYDAAGRQLARYVAEQAERDISIVERKSAARFPKRFNIFLYNNYDEARQTNIGRRYESQLQNTSSAGTVELVGDKLVVYFTGVHTDLRRQLRTGLSRVLMERMLFGENIREMVKNAVSNSLPRWVTVGYIAYLVDGWDAPAESDWKNLLLARPGSNFYELADAQPELAGKAFWKYVSDKYGEETVRSLLRTMQSRNSVAQGMKTTLKGLKVKYASDSVLNYYRTIFEADALVQETPLPDSALVSIPVPTDGSAIRQIRVSPSGSDVAWVQFREGQYSVNLKRTGGQQQQSTILRMGVKDWNEQLPDPDYPQLAWSNSGFKLAILYKSGGKLRLRIYNAIKARIENYVIPANRFDRALGMTFNEDDDRIVFSAIKKSQTDLYSFTIRGSRLTPITNDIWDDVQPAFISGGARRGILFLSNRPAPNLDVPIGVNDLPTGPMNCFFYDTKTQRRELLQCSFIKDGSISQAIQYGPDNFAYIYDANGVRNKYVVVFGRTADNLDSAISVPITNYSRSLLSHQYNAAGRSVADVLQLGDRYQVFVHPLRIPGRDAAAKELRPTTLLLTQPAAEPVVDLPGAAPLRGGTSLPQPAAPAIQGGTVFQSEFTDTATTAPRAASMPDIAAAPAGPLLEEDTADLLNPMVKDSTYLKLKSQRYRLSFKPDFFTIRADNSVLFNRYQSVAFNGGGFVNPPLSGLITVSLNDALEDHRFTGGIQLPLQNGGMTYFLQYENFKRRWDWGLLYLRTGGTYPYVVSYADSTGQPLFQREEMGRQVVNILQGSGSYAFDRIRRIGLHLGLRRDVLDFKSQDIISLGSLPRTTENWVMSRAEFVFDNSIRPAQNILNGYRYKLFAEYMYKMSGEQGGMYNVGLDFRYYRKLYKNTILATRFAAAHSAGDYNVLYYMGGVDNWISPRRAAFSPTSTDVKYGFQAQSNSLRGYEQGARNGNTYGLANIEVRFPILPTLMRRPIQSQILRSLQLVGFTDVGSAWDGLLPNAGNLTKNVQLPQGQPPTPPVFVQVNAAASTGLAMGYGLGLRGTLFGYFARIDAAWNAEGRRRPILYLAIGTDF